jgi:hypothetical protein
MKTLLSVLALAGLWIPCSDSYALGEVFRLKAKITSEVCTNTASQGDKIDQVYLRLDSPALLTLSTSAAMDQDVQLIDVERYVGTGRKSAAFLSTLASDRGKYRTLTVLGKVKFNNFGGITKLSGSFIARKVDSDGEDCMNTGTFSGKLQ